MTRTLQLYLSKDLARVALLALVAFTLVMTVFMIIEPLRKQNLGTVQVVTLVGYMVPLVLSLTLPVAALFAATIVYGRFAQDNELMACRASGVSTTGLVVPALVLGALVTVASLLMGNFVAPRLMGMAEGALLQNPMGIAQHQLRTDGHMRFKNFIVHADYAEPLGANQLRLQGVVVADMRPSRSSETVMASSAVASFLRYDGELFISIDLKNAQSDNPRHRRSVSLDEQSFEWVPLRELFTREQPKFYDWNKLLRLMEKPYLHAEVRQSLKMVRRAIVHNRLAQDIVAQIRSKQPYARLSDQQYTYIIHAGSAVIDRSFEHSIDRGERVLLRSTSMPMPAKPVRVEVFEDGRLRQVVTADSGTVRANYTELDALMGRPSHVSITLERDVTVQMAGEAVAQPHRRDEWSVGQLALPPEIAQLADSLTPELIFTSSRELTADTHILNYLRSLKTRRVAKFVGEIIAEMHSRVAYGMSCFLLVTMGAALGLIFRGGQIISAFVLSMLPAAAVIVLVIMGKEMVSNPNVQMQAGLAAIWGGVVAVLVANVAIYFYLARR